MGDAVERVVAHVEDQAVPPTGRCPHSRPPPGRCRTSRPEQLSVLGGQVAGIGHMAARHHQNVDGGCRVDVAKRVGRVARRHLGGRDLATYDPAEEAVGLGHRPNASPRPGGHVDLRSPRQGVSVVAPVVYGRSMGADPESQADALLSAFARWSAEVRVRDEAAGRTRQRWLHQQASEAATFTGTLLDLAEQTSRGEPAHEPGAAFWRPPGRGGAGLVRARGGQPGHRRRPGAGDRRATPSPGVRGHPLPWPAGTAGRSWK